MNTAYEKLIERLDQQQVKYSADGGDCSVCADFCGEVGHYRIWIQVTQEADLFQIFGLVPLRIPVGARQAVAEVVTRANCGLRVGKFELNLEEGDVRFQAAQILGSMGLEADIIDSLMSTTLGMLDRYLPVILSVIYANEAPADAVRRAELDVRPQDSQEPEPPDDDLPL